MGGEIYDSISHLLLPWSSIGPVDLAVSHGVPSEPIPVLTNDTGGRYHIDGKTTTCNIVYTTSEENVWMGGICNPNPCQRDYSIFAFLRFFVHEARPPIQEAKEEMPIVLGSKVVRVPINFPQFC